MESDARSDCQCTKVGHFSRTEVTPQYKRIHYSTGKWQQQQQQHSLQEERCLSAPAVFAVNQLIRLEGSLNRFQQKFS